MKSDDKRWQTRWNMANDIRHVHCLCNNKHAANARQMISNLNEEIHMMLMMWTRIVQQMGPQTWNFTMKIMEIKVDKFCLKYIYDNMDKYPNVKDYILDELSVFLDDMIQFKSEFDAVYRNGYQDVLLSPFKQKDINVYKKLGVVKNKNWNAKDDKSALSYFRKLVVQNPSVTLTDNVIQDFWEYKKQRFSVETITNKLKLLFFKYLSLLSFSNFLFYEK